MDDAEFMITMRKQVEEMPRMIFCCGKDWIRGPGFYEIGVAWDRNFEAMPGELMYRKAIVLRWQWRFRIWIDRR